jgi:N-carbamoylputrescine amidase
VPEKEGSQKPPAGRVVQVGLVQMACSEDAEQNLAKALRGVREAAGRGAQVVCLQELFRSRYFCQEEEPRFFDLAEPLPGPTTEAVAVAARELGVVVVTPVFERRASGVYHNSLAVIDADGSLAGRYRKMHIPHDPLYFEKYYFTPGDAAGGESGFASFPTRAARVGPLICWDQWYPEAARLTALAGAEILFYPTAIGWHLATPAEEREREREAWETVQRAHAIANGVFVVAVNRVGREGSLQFWGSSFVADPQGVVLARASRAEEETMVVPCDLGRIEAVRRLWPFLRDRRVDAYGPIARRYLDG